MNGTLMVFDARADTEIVATQDKGLKIAISLSPFSLGDGLIQVFYSKDDRTRGPQFLLDVPQANMAPATIKLKSYLKAVVFETKADITITTKKYLLEFTANYFKFKTDFTFDAKIGARLDFNVTANFELASFQRFKEIVVRSIAEWADTGSKDYKDAEMDIEKANKDVAAKKAAFCDWTYRCRVPEKAVRCKKVRRDENTEVMSSEDAAWQAAIEESRSAVDRLEKRLLDFTSWMSEKNVQVTKQSSADADVEEIGVVEKVAKGLCPGYVVISGVVVNTTCQSACAVSQGALDFALGVLGAATDARNSLPATIRGASQVKKMAGSKLSSMLEFRSIRVGESQVREGSSLRVQFPSLIKTFLFEQKPRSIPSSRRD